MAGIPGTLYNKKETKMSEPRAKTERECCSDILAHMRELARYWGNLKQEGMTPVERCEGVVFSVLVMFDGGSVSLPAMDIVMRPHESDKDYCKENGENWYEDGMVVNSDKCLHEELN
jgi:hypothetical protein